MLSRHGPLLSTIFPFLSHHLTGACLVGAVLFSACENPTAPPAPADLRHFVTGVAAEQIDARGQFVLPTPVAPDEFPIITPERAGELAFAYVRSFGPVRHTEWEKQRGRAINLDGLRVDPHIFYARSPYGRFPDGYQPGFRKAYGPYYVVRLTSDGTPVLAVAVSAYNTDVGIDSDGQVELPPIRGNEFVAHAIPTDTAQYFLLTPEEATIRIARLTGMRITEVPELLLLGRPYSPTLAVWELVLDRPVRVRTAQGAREAQQLYIGSEPTHRLTVAAEEQPTVYVTTALRAGADGVEQAIDTVRIPIDRGQPTVFVRATIQASP